MDRDDGWDLVLADRSEPHKIALAIKPLGTVRVVEIRFSGCRVLNESDPTYMPEWLPGSDPLKFEVMLPGAAESVAPYLEIRWLNPRPRRYLGQRMNLRTRHMDAWQWQWRSLRWRGRRPRRTRGRWVAHHEWAYPDIPAVD